MHQPMECMLQICSVNTYFSDEMTSLYNHEVQSEHMLTVLRCLEPPLSARKQHLWVRLTFDSHAMDLPCFKVCLLSRLSSSLKTNRICCVFNGQSWFTVYLIHWWIVVHTVSDVTVNWSGNHKHIIYCKNTTICIIFQALVKISPQKLLRDFITHGNHHTHPNTSFIDIERDCWIVEFLHNQIYWI